MHLYSLLSVNMSHYNKVDIFITSRASSTRLKNKYSAKIGGYHSIIFQILRALDLKKNNNRVGKVVLTTGDKKRNFIFEKYLKNFDVEIFYGDEDNMAKRYYKACEKLNSENFLRCLADDIFFCKNKVNKLINFHLNNQNDYTLNNDVCVGTSLEIINKKFVKLLLDNKCKYTEYLTYYAKELKKINKKIVEYNLKIKFENIFKALTLDDLNDFKLMNFILEITKTSPENFNLNSVLKKMSQIEIPKNIILSEKIINYEMIKKIEKELHNVQL